MARTCDPRCYDLAELFLEGEGIKTPQTIYELACDIQETIEDFIEVAKRELEEGK
jgi:hypothetical protein